MSRLVPLSLARRIGRSYALAATALLVLWLACAPSHAQDASDSTEYRRALDQAVAEYQAGNYLEARTLFARAHALHPSARTLRGLGAVSFDLREYADSVGYLTEALASKERPLDGAMRAESAQLLARARSFVARLRVDVQPPNATVSLDGGDPVPVARELLINVGSHELEFAAAERETVRRSLKVLGGEELHWELALTGVHAPTAGVLRSDDRPATRTRRTKIALLSSTLSVAALTGVALGMRESKARTLHDHCPVQTAHCAQLENAGKAWRTVAIASGAASAALLGLTVVWYWRDRRSNREHAVMTACALGLASPGVSCEARF